MNIKFVGDFKKLIPMGFTFHRLYANNYKVYSKNRVWIWVAHGGYVEIADFYDHSVYIAKRVLDGTYPIYKEDKDYGVFIMEKGRPKSCMFDYETGNIVTHSKFIREVAPNYEYDHERFRELNLHITTMETILEIKDMIEIVENEQ